MTTKAGTIEKEISNVIQVKKINNVCWWHGKKCSYNPRGGGLENANLAWCMSCREPDAEHLMRFAVEIMGERCAKGETFRYEGAHDDESSRLVCLAWREED